MECYKTSFRDIIVYDVLITIQRAGQTLEAIKVETGKLDVDKILLNARYVMLRTLCKGVSTI